VCKTLAAAIIGLANSEYSVRTRSKVREMVISLMLVIEGTRVVIKGTKASEL
jgi:hypothetical protein